jgi:hypothetical protein
MLQLACPAGRSKWLPSEAATSEGPGGTNRTSYASFAISMDLREWKSPSNPSDLLKTPINIEAMRDARTKLAGFFSVLSNRSMQETA